MTQKPELTAADFKVGQKVCTNYSTRQFKIKRIEGEDSIVGTNEYGSPIYYKASEIKPILRRLDSMTTKEWEIYEGLFQEFHYPLYDQIGHESKLFESIESTLWAIDNNFDVRGWIKSGLAVDAATLEGDGNV